MLICSTSARPQHTSVLADLAETASALDAPTSGTVFNTLVDDPASALDLIDAYLGTIMAEAASAADSMDATKIGAGTVYATFDGVNTNVTVSGGGLIVTHAGGGTYNGARSTMQKNSGKWYFEITKHLQITPYDMIGILTPAGSYTNMVSNFTNSASDRAFSGGIGYDVPYTNGSFVSVSMFLSASAPPDPVTIGIAVDLDNDRIWFRYAPSGNWNGSAIADPATNAGGVDIAPLNTTTVAPAVGFNGTTGTGQVFTGNFGASAFSGATPSGFSAGWF